MKAHVRERAFQGESNDSWIKVRACHLAEKITEEISYILIKLLGWVKNFICLIDSPTTKQEESIWLKKSTSRAIQEKLINLKESVLEKALCKLSLMNIGSKVRACLLWKKVKEEEEEDLTCMRLEEDLLWSIGSPTTKQDKSICSRKSASRGIQWVLNQGQSMFCWCKK